LTLLSVGLPRDPRLLDLLMSLFRQNSNNVGEANEEDEEDDEDAVNWGRARRGTENRAEVEPERTEDASKSLFEVYIEQLQKNRSDDDDDDDDEDVNTNHNSDNENGLQETSILGQEDLRRKRRIEIDVDSIEEEDDEKEKEERFRRRHSGGFLRRKNGHLPLLSSQQQQQQQQQSTYSANALRLHRDAEKEKEEETKESLTLPPLLLDSDEVRNFF
jgi:hypothetical protein